MKHLPVIYQNGREYVAIVRCRDCANGRRGAPGFVICNLDGKERGPDWFCGNGEEKQ